MGSRSSNCSPHTVDLEYKIVVRHNVSASSLNDAIEKARHRAASDGEVISEEVGDVAAVEKLSDSIANDVDEMSGAYI